MRSIGFSPNVIIIILGNDYKKERKRNVEKKDPNFA